MDIEKEYPDPWNEGIKLPRWQLDQLRDKSKRNGLEVRMVDGNSTIEVDERCIAFSVGAFGKYIDCLMVKVKTT